MMSVMTRGVPPQATRQATKPDTKRYQLESGLDRMTPTERAERGKEARAQAPRESHAVFDPPADRPDPIDLLEEQASRGCLNWSRSGRAG